MKYLAPIDEAEDLVTRDDARNASNLASGTVPTARLGSGTASSATYYRGDQTHQNFDTAVRANRLDQMAAPTASVSANSQKITNLAAASANGDAVRYEQMVAVAINEQTGTSYTLVLADEGKLVRCNNAAAFTLTVPPNSSVAFATGTRIVLSQAGAGQVTVAPGSGVTLNKSANRALTSAARYAQVTLVKTGTDTWLVGGELTDATTVRVEKTADEVVNNSAVLQDDDHLSFSIAANERWGGEVVLFYQGDTTADLRAALTVPTGSVIRLGKHGARTADTVMAVDGATTSGGHVTAGAGGASTMYHVALPFYVAASTTAGTVQVQWAQNVTVAQDTTVLRGSFLTARRLS